MCNKYPKFSAKNHLETIRLLCELPMIDIYTKIKQEGIYLEGWHRRFRSIVAISHANIYDSTHCLRGDSSRTEIVFGRITQGRQFPQRK